tara:strand:- start:6 stop:461 length:456 start_codon:yes stop_codon:yes gene_type:complete
MKKEALFSKDKKSRYTLGRFWNDSKDTVLFIMLNPSNANLINDDPTINRLISFSKIHGFGGFWVCNLYAFITPYPRELVSYKKNKCNLNMEYIKSKISISKKIIYGWGAKEKEPKWLASLVKKPYCFGKNKNGTPKHPLYLRKKTKIIEYR